MKSTLITMLVLCFALTGCYTYDPYTGEKKISDTTKGAGIGAATGIVVGLLTGGDAAAHRKNALIAAGVGALGDPAQHGLVESLGHKVTGIARTHAEALALAKAKRPGLILADIQLADGSSGLDAVNELLMAFEVPVIFITAYPERFLTGERPEPAFLVSKPYQPATVSALVSQALFFERNAVQRKRRAS